MKPIYYFFVYLAVISFLSIVITCLDKYKASHHRWRVRESTLLIFSALGGSIAMYITMHIIRHKTRKLKFMLGIPLIIILQAAAVWAVYTYVL